MADTFPDLRQRLLAGWDRLSEQPYRLADWARWKLVPLLNRSSRTCFAELYDWATNHRRGDLRKAFDAAQCRAEGRDPKCGVCWCGKFMLPEMRAAQDALNASEANGVRAADLPDDDPWAEVPRG